MTENSLETRARPLALSNRGFLGVTMISIRIFGKLSVQQGGRTLEGLHAGKPLELFCYLLLHRDRFHSREALASLLWGNFTTAQSKKYLRQVLWQLQTIFYNGAGPSDVLLVTRDSVRFNSESGAWLDVAVFEKAYEEMQGVPSTNLNAAQAQILTEAADLYQGDLLEGWYQDWCLFERERLQNIYLAILGKLMCYCEKRGEYEAGLEFGERSLRFDRAHERTHQEMMRLHYLGGNRAGALRQYMRCEAALWEELEVKPAARTLQLLGEIRADREEVAKLLPQQEIDLAFQESITIEGTLSKIMARLLQLRSSLAEMQAEIQKEVQAFEKILPLCTKSPSVLETPSCRKAS